MKTNIISKVINGVGVAFLPACLVLSACTAEPDESNMYTFTGQTVEDILEADTSFTSFNYIVTRSGYNRILRSYGTYTCFAPENDAVKHYIDSLYDDDTNEKFVHNGMTAKSLEGLSDSLCEDIVTYHLLGTTKLETEMSSKGENFITLLGRSVQSSVNSEGQNVLAGEAIITQGDMEATNGVVHRISKVIPRSNMTVTKEFLRAENMKLFSELLVATGLNDSLTAQQKEQTFTAPEDPGDGYYVPTECKVGFTVFAETDDVFAEHGINNFEQLKDSCIKWYAAAANGTRRTATEGWYDYYRNNGIEISTGDDYKSPYNVVNMFVRYHILPTALNSTVLTLDNSIWSNDGYSGDAYDYYETMLPKTIMKIWKVRKEGNIYINRWVLNNTLTDAQPTLESMGSSSMHPVKYVGNLIDTENAISPVNGYIYPINDILLYNYNVSDGVLNERLRFDMLTLFPETSNNGFRGMHYNELQAMSGKSSASRVRFPIDFLDNVVVYNGNKTTIDMNFLQNVGSGNSYMLYHGDSFQGMGVYDLAVKMPPVPDGTYEIRVAVFNKGYAVESGNSGSMMQLYWGDSSDRTKMQAIDLPIDMRINLSDLTGRLAEIGYEAINNETDYPEAYEDRGLASDKVMRTHSYMREALSVVKEEAKTRSNVGRYNAYQFRRIVKTDQLKQQDYWLRIKTVLPDITIGKWQIDYIEFCPSSVYANGQYLEDVY